MAATFRSVANGYNSGSGSGASVTISKPTGVARYDAMVAFLTVQDGAGVTVTPPAGWTQEATGVSGDGSDYGFILSKIAGAAEAANYTFTLNGTSLGWSCQAVILAYHGNSIVDAVRAAAVGAIEQSTNKDAPSLTAVADDRLVCGWAERGGDAAWTTPASMTERNDVLAATGRRHAEADEVITSSGATGVRTASNTSDGTGPSFSLLIIPAPPTTLQGVGTTTPTAQKVARPTASPTGVATVFGDPAYSAAGRITAQGVGEFIRARGSVGVQPDFTVYDAYLDTLGLLFHQDDEGEYRPSTTPERLKPVRQDVGNNPHEVRPEFGDFFAQSEFSGGQGQVNFHRPGRDETRYRHSDSFDISEVGHLRHTRAVAEAYDSVNVGAVEQVGGLPFVADGTNVRRGDGNFPGTWTSENPNLAEGAQTVQDLTAEGDRLFAALGANGIHVRDAAGTWTHYNAVTVGTATRVGWFKDRLFAVGGTNSRSVYEVTAAASALLETLPEGWAFVALWEMGPYVYACAVNRNAGLGRVHHYGLNAAGTAIEKKGSTAWPVGQLPYSGLGFGASTGLVGVGKQNSAGGLDPVLYQVSPDGDGFLAYQKVAEEEGSGALDLPVEALALYGEAVLAGWSLNNPRVGNAREGIAALHLARTAFAPFLRKTTPGGTVRSVKDITVYKDRILFSLGSDGLYFEDLTKFAPQAELITSNADWNNAGQKVWDVLEVGHKPAPMDSTLTVQYSTSDPEEGDWEPAMTDVHTAGMDGHRVLLTGVFSRRLALRFLSDATPDGTGATEDLFYSLRSNPKPERTEFRLTRYCRVFERDRKDDFGEDVFKDPLQRVEEMQDLLYTTVTFLEPGVTWQVWVEAVAVLEPVQPLVRETGGEEGREGFIVRLDMVGTRES